MLEGANFRHFVDVICASSLSPRGLGFLPVPVLEVHLRHLQPCVHPDGVDQAVGPSRRLLRQ